MTQDELYRAMRPASANPDEERTADDLGRFGCSSRTYEPTCKRGRR
jgi:hypothetical protein